MPKLRNPVIAGALAAALASTTGYCVLQRGPGVEPPAPPVYPLPAPVHPEAILPFNLLSVEPSDALD